MNHLTSNQLQDYADGVATDRNDLEIHLRTCPVCTARLDALRKLETALRSVPLDRVSTDFTETMMKRLGIKESPSFAWTIFRNMAPLFALTIVIGIALMALKFSGVFQGSNIGQSIEATRSVYTSAGSSIATGVTTFNEWVGRYFSFAFAKSSFGLTMFLLAFFGVIALLDKFIFMPMSRRRV
ncbi:MAG: hypothetical protein HYR76_01565 [Ignavibacteria bacterium]|nr:hypothetical protein [Ignavibacteria bacterium]MBI3766712.1 hypothetical protein [Ignavibacteriales bacterium]